MTVIVVTVTGNAWAAFLPEVLPHVSGCSQLYAENAIRNAAREFCRRSHYHKAFLPGVTILANTPSYTFAGMPPETEVVRVQWGRLGTSTMMDFQTPDWLTDNFARDWEAQTGTPQYLTQDDEDTFRVVPYPTTTLADTLVLRVSVQPTETAAVVSPVLYQRHKLTIAKGALAMLMRTPNTPYYNPAEALKHETDFSSGIGRAAWEAFKGHTRARPRVRGHYF